MNLVNYSIYDFYRTCFQRSSLHQRMQKPYKSTKYPQRFYNRASCLSLITVLIFKALRVLHFHIYIQLELMSLMKRMSKKMFDYRLLSRTAKSPIFSTISFVAIFFLIYADSIVSNLSGNHHDQILDPHQTQKREAPAMESALSTSTAPLLPTQEKVDGEEDSETQDPLIPPDNISREERLNWFRRKLPELEILKSNDLSQKFHGRVLEFFNHGCSVQFYMTWFSMARSFGKREFLAVDTLFKVHPEGCLMIISNTMDTKSGYLPLYHCFP
jgi:lactosylceramide 4-alpha-galactosyltransferase